MRTMARSCPIVSAVMFALVLVGWSAIGCSGGAPSSTTTPAGDSGIEASSSSTANPLGDSGGQDSSPSPIGDASGRLRWRGLPEPGQRNVHGGGGQRDHCRGASHFHSGGHRCGERLGLRGLHDQQSGRGWQLTGVHHVQQSGWRDDVRPGLVDRTGRGSDDRHVHGGNERLRKRRNRIRKRRGPTSTCSPRCRRRPAPTGVHKRPEGPGP